MRVLFRLSVLLPLFICFFSTAQKSETNSNNSQSIVNKISNVSYKKEINENRSPDVIKYTHQDNSQYPRRWKIMKSVDLKAKKVNYPRKERIRIIKSPPPNVSACIS